MFVMFFTPKEVLLSILLITCQVRGDNLVGPFFTKEPPTHIQFSNSSGTVVPCLVDGRPRPSVTWTKKDGERLRDLPGLRYTRHDNSLVFPPFAAEDYTADVHAAVYRCEASNSVGTIGSNDVHVRAVVALQYEVSQFDEFAIRGNTAVLRCLIPSAVSDYVHVTAWERSDGLLITPDLHNALYGMMDNGALYVRDTTNSVTSLGYRCHTENSVTREKQVSKNFSRIIITEPRHIQPPRIIQKSSSVSVPKGSNITLSCVARGHPSPVYRWHRVVSNIPVSLRMSPSIHQDGGVLIFQNIAPLDSGTYMCHVSNSMGEDSMQVDLTVEEPLSVKISPNKLQADAGRSVTFSCNISGGPVDSTVWRKDMRLLHPNYRTIFLTPLVVQVKQLQRDDSGMYQCFAYRRSYSQQASARLVVGDVPPKFKSTFTEKTIRPGSYISLSCVASGSPQPRIQWTLDGIWPLTTKPGMLINSYNSGENTITSHVNFTSVEVADGGVYDCHAVNDAGAVRHSRRLNVFGPVFIRPLDNLTAVTGKDFVTMCPFGGFPYYGIKWKKDGRNVPFNQRQRIYANGTLRIMNVQLEVDSGQYSCEVSANQDSHPVSHVFRVIVRAGPKLANLSFRGNLHEGLRTAVTCIVLSGDGPLVTSWLKDGLPISERELDVNIMQQDDGFISTLTFKKLMSLHNGNYTCISTNDVSSDSVSAVLTVKVPPRWILEPSDVSAVVGRPARIDCQAEGVPQPHVRWKVASNDFPDQYRTIVSGSHIHILMNGSLNFRSVESSDAGYYLCEANNGFGPGLSAVVYFTVHSAPLFSNKFSVVSVRRGERVIIECNPTGDRPITFTWKKNGAALDLSEELRYSQTTSPTSDGESAKLVVDKAERKDSALMTCSASNEFGLDSMNIQVIVQDIPDAPQNLEIHDISSRSVRLSWKQPFDGNFPITRYTVMWRQIEELHFVTGGTEGGPIQTPGGETTVAIRGLFPNTRYFFRVKCENALGESQFGAEVAATTLEEPPSMSPLNVKATAISSSSINVTWEALHITGAIGFYVGFKPHKSSEPHIFKSVIRTEDAVQHLDIQSLTRNTEYNIVVQAYNNRGAGPPSQQVLTRTLEYDKPDAPVIRTYFATSSTLKLSWESKNRLNAPITGYVLHYRTDGGVWHETQLTGDITGYTLRDLNCGTMYCFFLVAFNSVGKGNGSETVSAKTDGGPPIAPDKRQLLSVNSSSVNVNLNSWHDGGCPITDFVIQYKLSGHDSWILVSNNIVPNKNVVITDLQSGAWYSLLMTARNEAGSTDAEYIFATLTLSGEIPPQPSRVSDVSGSFYKHLTITVPMVSSVVVLLVVSTAVCFVTRRWNSNPEQRPSSNCRNPTKTENVQMSVYDGGQESIYLPEPYATDVVSGYNRGQCHIPGSGNNQNVDSFGNMLCNHSQSGTGISSRSGKTERIYEQPKYIPEYHSDLKSHIPSEYPVYEIPNLHRMKLDSARSWRECGDGDSSTGSEGENLITSLLTADDIHIRDEARESETECDRLWKTFEFKADDNSQRWINKHAIMA